MALYTYNCAGLFQGGGATCVNNVNLSATFVADDSLEPFTYVSQQFATKPSCAGNPGLFAVGVRDKNAQPIYTSAGSFNGFWNLPTPAASRFSGTSGLTITRGATVSSIAGYDCVNGNCLAIFSGQGIPFYSVATHGSAAAALAACRAGCRGNCSGCPPGHVCFTQAEADELYRLLELANKEFKA